MREAGNHSRGHKRAPETPTLRERGEPNSPQTQDGRTTATTPRGELQGWWSLEGVEGGRRITLCQTATRAVLVTLHGDRGFAHSLSDSSVVIVLAPLCSQGVLWDPSPESPASEYLAASRPNATYSNDSAPTRRNCLAEVLLLQRREIPGIGMHRSQTQT